MLEQLTDWMIDWLNDWLIERLTDWMIVVSISGGKHDYFVSCLLEMTEMTKITKMTKLFLDDPFLFNDISKQNYESNGSICLKISQEL
jgi:hypothetical protein